MNKETLQRRNARGEGEDCNRKKQNSQDLEIPRLNRSVNGNNQPATLILQNVLHSPGRPLDTTTQARMEAKFGHDFSHVRVHSGSEVSRQAAMMSAIAFTKGSHIFLGLHASRPDTLASDRALTHELVHVIQHSEGRLHNANVIPSPDDPAEREAFQSETITEISTSKQKSATLHSRTQKKAPSTDGPLMLRLYNREELERYADELNELGINGPNGRDELVTADHLISINTEPPGGLEDADAALNILRQVGQGLQRGWNRGQDDLGWPGPHDTRAIYPTPIHYGSALLRFVVASGTTSYSDYYQNHTVVAQLAGAPMRIHPRAVYFVAAAQLEMDQANEQLENLPEASELSGQHYISPPALVGAVRVLRRRLRQLLPRRTERAGRGRDRLRQSTAQIEQRRQHFENILRDAQIIVASARIVRERNLENLQREQSPILPEPIVDWLVGAPQEIYEAHTRASRIENMEVPTGDGQITERAAELYAMLDQPPSRVHGMGAMDAHGTAHAMGLAIDYGTSSRSRAENRGIPQDYWPFLYYLMERYTPTDTITGWNPPRPSAIHQMGNQARQLSAIVQTHAAEEYERITGCQLDDRACVRETLSPSSEGSISREATRTHRRDYQRLVRESRAVLRSVQTDLRYLLTRVTRQTEIPAVARRQILGNLSALEEAARSDIRTLGTMPPTLIRDRFQWYASELASLELRVTDAYNPLLSDARRRESMAEQSINSLPELGAQQIRARRRFEREHRRASGNVSRLEALSGRATRLDEQIGRMSRPIDQAITDGVESQWRYDQLEALRRLLNGRQFQGWLRDAIETGLYTQSEVYEIGVRSVTSHPTRRSTEVGESHFYGGHHWDIAPLEIITDPLEYQAALRRDISNRSSEELQQIVEIIQEWRGGTDALEHDDFLHRVMGERLGGAAGERRIDISQSQLPD